MTTDRKSRATTGQWAMGLAIGFAAFVLLVLWLRTGLVPAASGGDEVWWSESGYHFWHEGTLRWGCIDDANGSAVVSYWPPIAPLIQAGLMKLFGLTAFGIYAQSSLVATALIGATYALGRALGLPKLRAVYAGCALLGLFMVERRLVQVRMENLTALAAVIYAAVIARASTERSGQVRSIAAGAILGIGLLCYYPQSPFLLLAGAASLLPLRMTGRNLLAIALGTIVPLALAAIWVAPHWDLFRRQILAAGANDYWSIQNVLGPFRRVIPNGDYGNALQQCEKWAVLLLGIYSVWTSRSATVRSVGVMTVAMSLPMFVYVDSPQVAAGALAIVLVFHLANECEGRRHLGWRLATLGLVVATAVKTALLGYTAYAQYPGRSYRAVAAELRRIVPMDQPVAIGQRAWLGLRDQVADPKLQFLTYNGPSLRQRPRAALAPDADRYFATLVLESHTLETLKIVYPWIGRGIETGEYQLVETIALPWTPLPWAKDPCYRLLVYRRSGRDNPSATQ